MDSLLFIKGDACRGLRSVNVAAVNSVALYSSGALAHLLKGGNMRLGGCTLKLSGSPMAPVARRAGPGDVNGSAAANGSFVGGRRI